MSDMAKWIERKFPYEPPIDTFPMVLERLRGTPCRLEDKIAGLSRDALTRRPGEDWSLQEHAGHLLDLEPLWSGRLDDFDAGAETLRAADMSNAKTYGAGHNDGDMAAILKEFRETRIAMVRRLEAMGSQGAARTALHPRLQQPMRVIDLCWFVAEHDDHHLTIMTRLRHGA